MRTLMMGVVLALTISLLGMMGLMSSQMLTRQAVREKTLARAGVNAMWGRMKNGRGEAQASEAPPAHAGSSNSQPSASPVVVQTNDVNDKNNPAKRTIFVSIAAFRDVECQDTIRDIYAKAAHPERVHLGVVCQRDMTLEDEKCYPHDWEPGRHTIRMTDHAAAEAKGPTWARHLAGELYDNEDYFFMIDAHNTFVQGWDADIIAQHDVCDSPAKKCILSVYPMGLASKDDPNGWVAHLCANAKWTRGFPGPFIGQTVAKSTAPRPQPFIGGGLMFGPGQLVKDVPYDPHLHHVFFGEEILQAVRLWTAGYDLFSPCRNVLFHHYERKGRKTPPQTGDYHSRIEQSYKRIEYLLEVPDPNDPSRPLVTEAEARSDPVVWAEIEKYGMGTARTVQDYWKFARIDLAKKEHEAGKAYWCGTYAGQAPYSNQWKQEAGYPEGA